ncbi:MAG: flavodoxin domain-containing protein [Gammaproteobacteria bacterium]|nr:flavodoxin domain-containing protein [Gammaproteobacteria bacterium]
MNIHILVGTTSGNTEYLAEQLQDQLTQEGHQVTFHDQPAFDDVPQTDCLWLLCIATHGAGEYADSIAPFMEAVQQHKPNLSAIKVALIAVGDSSYDTFCQAGRDA